MAIKCICLIGVIILMMTEDMDPHEKYGKASYSNGYWYYFEDEENDITVNASAWSGKERVFINDELVSSKRRLTRQSSHAFHYHGVPYEVQFRLTSFLAGEHECRIIKAGEEIGRKRIAFYSGSASDVARKITQFFLMGIFAGAGTVMLAGLLADDIDTVDFGAGVATGLASVGAVFTLVLIIKHLRNKS